MWKAFLSFYPAPRRLRRPNHPNQLVRVPVLLGVHLQVLVIADTLLMVRAIVEVVEGAAVVKARSRSWAGLGLRRGRVEGMSGKGARSCVECPQPRARVA